MQPRLMLRRDLPGQAALLAEAFQDDPVFAWMFPGAAARPRQLTAWFGKVLDFSLDHGHCYRLGDDAAAIWIPPDVDQLTGPQRSELVELVSAEVGHERAMTILQGFGAAGAHRPEGPSWLLWYVGVRPGRQDAGLGAQALRPVLERMDADALPAYLHSTNARNLPFYERLGWKTLAEVPMPGDGPVIRPMWREPR